MSDYTNLKKIKHLVKLILVANMQSVQSENILFVVVTVKIYAMKSKLVVGSNN